MKDDTTRYYLIKRILTILNEKFTSHGLRVAYIMLKICEYSNIPKDLEMRKLIEICIFHDIGAYNTEEVKDMLRFETVRPLQHSTYGYLFLKYLSSLGDYSEIILYHHTKYQDRNNYQSDYIDRAIQIHFIDRVDISNMNYKSEKEVLSNLKRLSGTWFNPEDVNLFMEANEKYNIIQHLRDETYEQEIIDFYKNFSYDFDGIIDVLKMLVYSIDFRSEQTVIHTIASAVMSRYLGKKFSLSAKEQDSLYFGALLHDIGKICVPIEILESKHRLSEDEMAIMRNHVVETGNIIRGFVPEDILRIAVRHHERCDGKGYPLGLDENSLTISEKIVSVSDVFCALVEKRSYKNQLNKSEVMEIMQSMADERAFDSEIVRVAIDCYDIILEEVTLVAKEIRGKYENLKREYLEVIEQSERRNFTFIRGNDLFPDFDEAV